MNGKFIPVTDALEIEDQLWLDKEASRLRHSGYYTEVRPVIKEGREKLVLWRSQERMV